MSKITKYFFATVCFTIAPQLFAQDVGANANSLNQAIKDANSESNPTLNFTHDINLSSEPIIVIEGQNILLNGNHQKLNGEGKTRGLFIRNPHGKASISINDLIFSKTTAKGGEGHSSGGGGLGAGGGLFVGKNSVVTLKNCSFLDCTAMGGSGAQKDPVLNSSSGGGGGMGGNGGIGAFNAGGGGGGFFVDGENSSLTFEPGLGGGNGGNGNSTSIGSDGGFGGGGGGSPQGGGRGGFGGGGGGGACEGKIGGAGGHGGFGGGGGGAMQEDGGLGGFGGATGNRDGVGGHGAGFGGAIFIETGGELIVKESIAFQDNRASVPAGTSYALGHDIFMMSEGKITFDLSKDLLLDNPICGNIGKIAAGISNSDTTLGGLNKKGAANLRLEGNNTYTGRTVVEEGGLHVEGSLLNTIEVKEGARLTGAFKVHTVPTDEGARPVNSNGDLVNYGTVAPGKVELGTIEVAGNFIQHPTGTLEIDIKPSADKSNDTLKVNGSQAILNGGKLQLILHPGNYIAGTQFVIIDGPTVGQFDTIETAGPLAGLLDFNTTYGSVIATVLNNRLFMDQLISASPARAVSRCISDANIIPGSDFAGVVQELGTFTNSQVNHALIDLSPAQYGAIEWINARNNSYIVGLLSQYQFELCCSPRDCCNCCCQTNIWVNGFGNFINNHGWYDHLRPFQANAGGVLAGIDYCFNPCNYIGASFGYTYTDLHWKNHGGKGHMNSYYGALYSIFKTCYFNIDISVIGGGTDYDLKRHLLFGTINRTARSDFWGWFLTSHVGLRGNWECSCLNLEPFALVDYHYWRREGFHEHGAQSLDLNVRAKTQNMLRTEAGIKGYYSIMCDCSCFAPFLGLSYVGEFPLHKSKQRASFTGQFCVIQAASYDDIVNLGSPEVGMKWTHCNGFSFVVGYKGLFNNKTSINEVEGRLEWVF